MFLPIDIQGGPRETDVFGMGSTRLVGGVGACGRGQSTLHTMLFSIHHAAVDSRAPRVCLRYVCQKW